MSQRRALLHLVPAGDGAALVRAVARLTPEPGLTRLVRADDCFVGAASPYMATIQMTADRDTDVALPGRCGRLLDTLGDTVDRPASMALVGADISFMPAHGEPSPFRFQYLMRRRRDFTHDDYLRRYRDVHSEFGLRTPNLDAYVQHHVDLPMSATLAEATGLLEEPCDSMSELHFRSVAHFLAGVIAHPEVGQEAQEDEERFVDRPRSFGFCQQVLQG